MYYCSTAIILCLHTFSISRQLLETSASASDGTPARVEISNIPEQKQEGTRVIQFWHQQQIVKYFVLMTGNPIYYLNMPGFLDTSWNAFEARNPCWRGLGWQTRADAVSRCPDPRQLIKKVPAQLGQYILYIPSHYHDLGILKTGSWQ